MQKTCTALIAAFKATDTITDAISSLQEQSLPKGWKLKILVSADGCDETHNYLKKNKINHYFSQHNYGTYVQANTLIDKAKGSDLLFRFDADDVALRDFIKKGIAIAEDHEFCCTVNIWCDSNLKVSDQQIRLGHGSCFFTPKALKMLGGYHHYRVGCDTDFLIRAKNLRLVGGKINPSEHPLYLYRRANNSLTTSSETGFNSTYRKQVASECKSYRNRFGNFVKPLIAPVSEWVP